MSEHETWWQWTTSPVAGAEAARLAFDAYALNLLVDLEAVVRVAQVASEARADGNAVLTSFKPEYQRRRSALITWRVEIETAEREYGLAATKTTAAQKAVHGFLSEGGWRANDDLVEKVVSLVDSLHSEAIALNALLAAGRGTTAR